MEEQTSANAVDSPVHLICKLITNHTSISLENIFFLTRSNVYPKQLGRTSIIHFMPSLEFVKSSTSTTWSCWPLSSTSHLYETIF